MLSKKNPYRAVAVKDFELAKLKDKGPNFVLAIDIAKKAMKAAIMDQDGAHVGTVKWDHPKGTPEFNSLLEALGKKTEVVAESTGTYANALVESIRSADFQVFQVGTKRSHDAAEVFDGVPSKHDGKDAVTLGLLHLNGCSRPWPHRSAEERDLQAAVRMLHMMQESHQQSIGRLEALLAEYWPGVTDVLELDRATLWALVDQLGWSGGVNKDTDRAREVMRKAGGHFLSADRIEAVLHSASFASGREPTPIEQEELQLIVKNLRESKARVDEIRRQVAKLGEDHPAVASMAPVLGSVTAAVVRSEAGDPGKYGSSAAFVKSLGLNLRERSSGKHQGQLKITKRGPSRARKYIYLAALRCIQKDVVVAAWYDAKVKRQGGRHKKKAVVAVMRKLMRAMVHVARGKKFDAAELFDVRKLNLAQRPA